MTAFLLNPYDASLNLTNKDDRKLFQDGCKGLSDEEQIFDGKRENVSKFSKLLAKEFDDTRMMESLRIPTSWPATGSASEKRTPLATGMIDIFKSHRIDQQKVKEYSAMVWSDSMLGSTTELFDIFDPVPTSINELNTLRNNRRLKHVMLGNKV